MYPTGTSIWARFAVETQAVVELLQEKQSLGTEPTTSKISKKRINQSMAWFSEFTVFSPHNRNLSVLDEFALFKFDRSIASSPSDDSHLRRGGVTHASIDNHCCLFAELCCYLDGYIGGLNMLSWPNSMSEAKLYQFFVKLCYAVPQCLLSHLLILLDLRSEFGRGLQFR
jgi:hypothetical protein